MEGLRPRINLPIEVPKGAIIWHCTVYLHTYRLLVQPLPSFALVDSRAQSRAILSTVIELRIENAGLPALTNKFGQFVRSHCMDSTAFSVLTIVLNDQW